MAISQKEVNIKGTDYLITQLPGSKGVVVMKQLTKLLGPSLAEAQESGSMAGAIDKLIENIDSVDVLVLLQNLMTTVTKKNVQINFDLEFAGNYDGLFLLTKEVINLNFESVFTLLGFAPS